jgi:uncharacterized protein YdaU (DUF1376 family)
MTTEELGACFRLLCRQWIDGTLPDDLSILARFCRLDAKAMGQAWLTLCHFFPEIGEGRRANRFMFLQREEVLAEMARKSGEGVKAARKRWDEVAKKKDATPNATPNGSGMPEAMQETESEKNKKQTTPPTPPASPEGKSKKPRKKREEILMDFCDETKAVVNALMPVWRKEQPNGDLINARVGEFAQAMEAIFDLGTEWFSVDILTLAGKLYLEEKINFYRAPQHFFSTAEKDKNKWPWLGHARMAYRKLNPKSDAAPAESSLTTQEAEAAHG